MIEARHISKRYGDHEAVRNLSFSVRAGEVVGFLGPNGAGKTTVMRILTGFIPATDGTALIAGHDIFDEPLAARRSVGYLPETPPLYPEMDVGSFLRYVARLKDVPRARVRDAVDRAVERCGLRDVHRRVIGTLSKGYRQRVGLAQAIVHEPPVLILDEPTVGLDPIQIREIRGLISELASGVEEKRQTVVLSTHILAEVEMVCDHVVVINNGRIALTGSLEEITRAAGSGRVRLEVRGQGARVKEALEKVNGVRRIVMTEREGGAAFEVEVAAGRDAREDLGKAALAAGGSLLELSAGRASIEDVFVRITATEG